MRRHSLHTHTHFVYCVSSCYRSAAEQRRKKSIVPIIDLSKFV
jgi:hypothetical protein